MTETRIPLSRASPIRPRLPLAIVVAMACLAQFMVVLDSSIVTLALPKMSWPLPLTLAATSGVSPHDSGAAAGLLNTSRQVGGAIGLAVLTTVAATATSRAARHGASLAALVHGYHVAFGVDACVMVVAGVAALALARQTSD